MASQSRKHRGYRSQKVFADYIKWMFPHAEPTCAGRQGKDILSTPGVHFELKARTGFSPLAALKQIEKEQHDDALSAEDNGFILPPELGIAVLRMNGQGEATIGEWVTVMRVDTMLTLLEQAGYGEVQTTHLR